jgi:hypothetical protein
VVKPPTLNDRKHSKIKGFTLKTVSRRFRQMHRGPMLDQYKPFYGKSLVHPKTRNLFTQISPFEPEQKWSGSRTHFTFGKFFSLKRSGRALCGRNGTTFQAFLCKKDLSVTRIK